MTPGPVASSSCRYASQAGIIRSVKPSAVSSCTQGRPSRPVSTPGAASPQCAKATWCRRMTRHALAGCVPAPLRALLAHPRAPDLGERPDRPHRLGPQREDVHGIGPGAEGGADPFRRVLAVAGERDLPHEIVREHARGSGRLLELAAL